jgi:hypothetical protein
MEHITSWSMMMMLRWGKSINTVKKNTKHLLEASGEVCVEVNTDKIMYMVRLPLCRTES